MDPEAVKDTEPTPTKEEQAQIAHEKAVNDDPSVEPLPAAAEKEAKEAAKPAEPEGEAEKSPEDQFDAEILAMAADAGIDESTARSFSTVGDLERALLALSSREQPSGPKAEPAKEEVKKPEPIHIQAGDDLDEGLVKQFNEALDKISGRYDEQTAALQQTITDLTGRMDASQTAQFVTQFDAMLGKHGEAYATELGEGSTLDLSGTPRANREKILDEMGVLVAGYQLRNRQIPSDDQLIQRALKGVFGERKKDDGAVKKRQSQFLRRASSRSGTAPSKQMRAREELREKLAALGSSGEE